MEIKYNKNSKKKKRGKDGGHKIIGKRWIKINRISKSM